MWHASPGQPLWCLGVHECLAPSPSAAQQAPTQTFFTEQLGMPLTMTPNFEDYSCEVGRAPFVAGWVQIALIGRLAPASPGQQLRGGHVCAGVRAERRVGPCPACGAAGGAACRATLLCSPVCCWCAQRRRCLPAVALFLQCTAW